MRIYVYPTDFGWYSRLRASIPDRVNFWRISTKRFLSLSPGEPLLFKSKTSDTGIKGAGKIMGGAFFVEYLRAPVAEAWQAFEERNGVDSFEELIARLDRMSDVPIDGLTEIGCILLAMPFFLPRELWVSVHDPNLARAMGGSGYDLDTNPEAKALWDTVIRNAAHVGTVAAPAVGGIEELINNRLHTLPDLRRGAGRLVYSRLDQNEFRLSVLSAYDGRCGVTGERVRPTLEAAHIKPYALNGPSVVTNGLSLRADIHKLFDVGYVTVDPTCRFRVSPTVRSRFENGREYYQFDGEKLAVLPRRYEQRPSREFLKWHVDNVFIG